MAGKKKVVPQQSRSVEPRVDKVAKPKWGEVIDGRERSIMRSSPLRDAQDRFDPVKLYLANEQYGKNKKYGLELTDKDSVVIYRPAHLWKNKDGSLSPAKLKELIDLDRAQGKKTDFYEVPLSDPRQGTTLMREKRRDERVKQIRSLDTAPSRSRPWSRATLTW